jgi:hypothetical protein
MEFIAGVGPAYPRKPQWTAFLVWETPAEWVGGVPAKSFPLAIQRATPVSVVDSPRPNQRTAATHGKVLRASSLASRFSAI